MPTIAMSTVRLITFLLLSLTGTILSIPAVHAADTDPNPHPTLGLQFALSPSPPNSSFIEALHNSTSINARQATGPAAWATHWFPGPVCNPDGTCTSSSNDDIPHIKINGDGFTANGRVFGGIYKWPENTLKWGLNVNSHLQTGFRAGAFGLETPIIDCGPSDRAHVGDSFAGAYDWTTGKWSNFVWLYTGCLVL
ncbi:hypothetical protein F5882DRAFT_492065 [Hyaloscypha sp. PMI_1271]|nr:hypothetical protein F5882DRAFT_492065 [Hyaloscypha sp. PMI_1271]